MDESNSQLPAQLKQRVKATIAQRTQRATAAMVAGVLRACTWWDEWGGGTGVRGYDDKHTLSYVSKVLLLLDVSKNKAIAEIQGLITP